MACSWIRWLITTVRITKQSDVLVTMFIEGANGVFLE